MEITTCDFKRSEKACAKLWLRLGRASRERRSREWDAKRTEAVERPANGTMLSICAAVEETTPADAEIGDVLRSAAEVGSTAFH